MSAGPRVHLVDADNEADIALCGEHARETPDGVLVDGRWKHFHLAWSAGFRDGDHLRADELCAMCLREWRRRSPAVIA